MESQLLIPYGAFDVKGEFCPVPFYGPTNGLSSLQALIYIVCLLVVQLQVPLMVLLADFQLIRCRFL